MLRPVLLLLLLGFFGCAAPVPPPVAFEEVSGVLSGSTLWRGKIRLLDDVLIPRGSRLTILPGTYIEVVTADSTRIEPLYLSTQTELLVQGELYVAGTPEAPVRFVPVLAEGSLEQTPSWSGIFLDRAESAHLQGVSLTSGASCLQALETSLRAQDLSLEGCRTGVLLQGASEANIRGLHVRGGEGGLFLWDGASLVLEGARLDGQGELGLHLATDAWSLTDVEVSNVPLGVVHRPGASTSDSVVFRNVDTPYMSLRGGE